MPSDLAARPTDAQHQVLLAYVADLELEVDRLRKQGQFVDQTARETLRRIHAICAGPMPAERQAQRLAELQTVMQQFADVLDDVRKPLGYHPAHDQVVEIALRPLVEQVFRWQQRFWSAPQVVLRLELQVEYVEWFPVRLRHILENLVSNALKYRDDNKGETRLTVGLRETSSAYELRVSDNGMGMPPPGYAPSELFYRSAPARAAGLGVGLPVVKLLVEQSGGSLTTSSDEKLGTTLVAVLPRFRVDDFLEREVAERTRAQGNALEPEPQRGHR